MQFKNFFLMCLSIFPIISHQDGNRQTTCPVFEGNSVFVNITGKDSLTCGTVEKPCFSISYAVSRAVGEGFTSVLIKISAGIYKEADSIKLDCSRWKLQRISLCGERQFEKVVQVDFSLDVQFCDISFINLHWVNSRLVLHHVLLSNFTICHCTTQQTDVSIIGSSSNIILQDCSISNSSSYVYKQNFSLPLLSATCLPGYRTTMQIIRCNFSDNVGSIIFVGNVHQASIVSSHFQGNKAFSDRKIITSQFSSLNVSSTRFVQNFGTLLGIESAGSLNVSECLFQGNKVLGGSIILIKGLITAGVKDCVFQQSSSSKDGPVIRIEDSYSSASLEKCHFSCNMVNSSTFLPPVMSHATRQVSCDNCTVDDNCPVHCSPGEFLASGILCKHCPVGSYSPGIFMNKTVLHCASCPAGTYSAKAKSAFCTLCAEHTFSSKTGSTSCAKCKNDFFTSKPGQSSCSKFTVEFITLIVLVSLLITIPLFILLLQSAQANQEFNGCSCVRYDEHSPLLRKRKKTNSSIQNGYIDRRSLPGMSANA